MTAVSSSHAGEAAMSRSLLIGGVAGLIGGMAMAMTSMLVAISEDGFWAPVRGITSVVFGDSHYGGGFAFGPVVVGAMAHMMNSVVLGAVFAIIAGLVLARGGTLALAALGMVYGLVVWLVMVPGISSALQSSNLFADSIPTWAWVVSHLMFGVVTGAVYAWLRRSS